MKGGPRQSITSLEVLVKLWQPPQHSIASQRQEGVGFAQAQLLLPIDRSGHLETAPQWRTMWSTPRATDGEKGAPHQRWGSGQPLPTQAWSWATPTARDWRSDSPAQSPMHSPPLGRQVLRTPTAGEPSSTSDPTSRHRLNVTFCEWLIGWPLGWTACAVSETEWYRWSQHMRFALSRLR
jgi:hypothetical protein